MTFRRIDLLICLGIIGLIILIYAQVAGHSFIQYDDPLYMTDNPVVQRGLTLDGIRWSLQGSADGNWIPLTWLSHMADAQFLGVNPGRQHLVSVTIHAVNSILLFFILISLTGSRWRSTLVAGFWAVHPLHVESVAWIAERKDVLSALLFFLAIAAYTKYARQPTAARYALVLVLFLAALLAKPMVVTLPAVLPLLDYWPLRRLSDRQQIRRATLEKLPMLACAFAASVVTLLAQRNVGAVRTLAQFPLSARLLNAIVSISRYIAKTVCPVDLAVFYPPQHWSTLIVALAVLVFVGITFIAIWQRKKRPYLLVGWLWFCGMLVPVIGLVQVGRQSMADRYTYLPHVGLFIGIAWFAGDIAARGKAFRDCIVAGALVALIALSITAFVQVRQWQNTETVFAHALLVTDNNDVAHNQIGNVLSRRGDITDAEVRIIARRSPSIPNTRLAQMNLGNILVRRRQFNEAIGIILKPRLRGHPARNRQDRTGISHRAPCGANRYAESDEKFADVLKREPKLVQAHIGFAESLKERGRLDEAAAQFKEALKLDPQTPLLAKRIKPAVIDNEARRRISNPPASAAMTLIIAGSGTTLTANWLSTAFPEASHPSMLTK